MDIEEIDKLFDDAVPPPSLPNNLNIGQSMEYLHDDANVRIIFHPGSSNSSAFDEIRRYPNYSELRIHSHGIQLHIGSFRYNIHNSQIFLFERWTFDGTIEYNRCDSRGARVGAGLLLAGPLGAAVGLATSFGRGKKHHNSDYLMIGFWDPKTIEKKYVEIEIDKEGKHKNFIKVQQFWNRQVEDNRSYGSEAPNIEPAGKSETGCLGVVIGIMLFTACASFIVSCI